MIVRYHQVDENVRSDIRLLENKGHIAYIRYLLLKRTNIKWINTELTRLGLSGAEVQQYANYFDQILFPLIKKYKLTKYYKHYRLTHSDDILRFKETFGGEDAHRIAFCNLLKETETDSFFSKECVKHYGISNIPLDDEGNPIISNHKEDWADLLLHEKRHLIDGMIADGYSPTNISKHLDGMYDIQLSSSAVARYAKSFMNVKRKDLEFIIDGIEEEKKSIENQMQYVRDNEELFTIGERISSMATLKNKLEQLNGQLRKLRGEHGNASYSQGVLEFSNMREIFSDVMLRTHRRYQIMDEHTEHSIVDPLSKLLGMMAKATDKIVGLDTVMKETTKKTISEEMLEVVIPTLDRVEEEERLAFEEYQKAFQFKDLSEEEILGDDD